MLADSELRPIGDAAQAGILREHTSEIRAQQFEDAIATAKQKYEISGHIPRLEEGGRATELTTTKDFGPKLEHPSIPL